MSFIIMKKRVLIILFICTLAFIWGHSMVPRPASADESGFVLQLLYPVLTSFLKPELVTDHLVRKMAHFTEYFVLGMELFGLLSFFSKNRWIVLKSVEYAFFAAFIDESIQILSHRGSMISDVWLDTAGAAAGVLLVKLVSYIRAARK